MDALLAAASEEMMASSCTVESFTLKNPNEQLEHNIQQPPAATLEIQHSTMAASSSSSSSVSSSSSPQPSFVARHDNERFVNDDEISVDEHSSPPTNHVPFQLPIPSAAASRDGMNWQHMFQQLKDYQELGNRKIPSRMQQWMNAQRRQYKMYGIGVKKPTGIITNRIRQLNSIGFEWHVMTSSADSSSQVSQAVKKYPGSPIHPRVILPPSYNPNGKAIFHEGRPVTSKKKTNIMNKQQRSNNNSSLDDTQVMLNIIHGRGYARGQPYSLEEDKMIERYQKQWGNKWSKMAKVFNNGRTDKDIHNRAASLLRARQRAQHRRQMMELEESDNDNDDHNEESENDDDDSSYNNNSGGDRTGFVQKMVRAALAKERRGGRSLRNDFAAVKPSSSSTTSDGTTSRRTRKPTRRVRESYNPLGDDVSYTSEGDDDIHSSYARGSGSSSNKPRGLMSTPQGRKYFPDVLFQMVNDCSVSQPHVLDWIPDGSAFIVKTPSLMPSVLERYFRHNNLSSMTRMCYMYGFSKYTSGPYVGAYVHPHFTKFVSRESLFHNVIKVDSDHQSGGKKVPASKSKKVQHPKPGLYQSDGIPRHALFSPKQPSNNDDAHSRESKKKHLITSGPSRTERTEPTSNDILLTLKDDNYKEIMFTQFKIMGKKTKDESTDDVRLMAEPVFRSLVQRMRSNGGRFLRHTRGGGGTWYEAVDDDWALKSKFCLVVVDLI